jgi:hypothetical protein
MRWMRAELLGVCLAAGCGSAQGGAPQQPNPQGQFVRPQTAWGDDNQAPQANSSRDPVPGPPQNQPPQQQPPQIPPPPPADQTQPQPVPDYRWRGDSGPDGQ